MSWDLSVLISEAPLGFKLLECLVFYEGSKPIQALRYTLPVQDFEEALTLSRDYVLDDSKRPQKENSHALVIGEGNAGGRNYFFYRLNKEKLEELYSRLRKIYDNWYEREAIPRFNKILFDEEREFQVDRADFTSFMEALKDREALTLIRMNPQRTSGQMLALAYIDFLRENFENKRRSPKHLDHLELLYDKIQDYKTLETIKESPYPNFNP